MSHDFQVSEDGRLIIHDEEEEMEDDGAKGTVWDGRDYARPALALRMFFFLILPVHSWKFGVTWVEASFIVEGVTGRNTATRAGLAGAPCPGG